MAELKTTPNAADPRAFIDGVENERRRKDAERLLEVFESVTGEKPKMWGNSIVGYGQYDYRYESGRTGTWMKTGFSPRKQATTLYIMPGFDEYESLLARLGPHTTGKSCLYVKSLDQIDMDVLEELIATSFEAMGESSD